MDISKTGIAIQILTIVSNTLESPNPYLIPIAAIIVTILEILVMIHYIIKITEHRPSGIITFGTGFFGSLAVFLGTMAGLQIIMYVGVAMWILGIPVIRFSE